MKWWKSLTHDKIDRMKMTLFLVVLSLVFYSTLGFDEFISLLGAFALLFGVFYLINEIKSWFAK